MGDIETKTGIITQIELQEHLGSLMREVMWVKGGTKDFQYAMDRAEYGAKIAKQIINSADIVIRGDKMCNTSEGTKKVLGYE